MTPETIRAFTGNVPPPQSPDLAHLLEAPDNTGEDDIDGEDVQPEALSAAFTAGAAPPGKSPFLITLEKKPAQQVLDEMATALVGLDQLKRAARSLVFRQSYDDARAKEGHDGAGDLPRNYSTVLTGSDGIGKSSFAHKQAELLVALDRADPVYMEVTNESLGRIVGSQTQESLAGLFAKADIILLELPCAATPDSKQSALGQTLLMALQVSLKVPREKPPVVFLVGRPAEVEAGLGAMPGLQGMFANFTALEDPSMEQLAAALDRKLAKADLAVTPEARVFVQQELQALKSQGKNEFRNMREVESIVERIPDAIADRLFGTAKGQQELEAAADRKALLNTATLEDIKALNLKKPPGGPSFVKKANLGFDSDP